MNFKKTKQRKAVWYQSTFTSKEILNRIERWVAVAVSKAVTIIFIDRIGLKSDYNEAFALWLKKD